MKRIFTFFLALVASAGTLFAESGTCGKDGDNLTWDYTGSTLTISGTGEMANWSSSDKVPWQKNWMAIKTVVINNGVTSIGDMAFSACLSLEGIYSYAATPPTCGTGCFFQVPSNINIYVPVGTVDDYQHESGWSDFSSNIQCMSLSGTCGANLTWELGCDSVLTISGTGDMTNWSDYEDVPWYPYRWETKTIVVQEGVTSFGYWAFYNVHANSVTIPSTVTSIGEERTLVWDFLSINVAEGNPNYCSVGGVLFTKDTTALIQFPLGKKGTYVIPNSVTSIRKRAFMSCSLTYITIPNGVQSIGHNSFSYCDDLISIKIPGSVTSLDTEAFAYSNDALTSITCEAVEPPTYGHQCFYGVPQDIPVYVPKGKVEAYKATGWNYFTNIQENPYIDSGICGDKGANLTWTLDDQGKLTISGTGAMADYSNTNPWYDNRSSIKSVVIEAGVTSIGKYAFYNCDNLTSVTIPGSVTSIGNYAFNKCSSLASVTIPEGVISIGPRAFQNCTSLTSIELPEGITSIGIRTFYQCTSLKSVTIPAGVTNIYDEAFSGCNALTSITCKATTPPTCASNSFYAVTKSIPVYVPNVDAYTAASGWSSFTNIQSLYVASGTCGKEGDNLKWTLSKEGVLTISGTGEMAYWAGFSSLPWTSYYSSIKSVVIEEGVTNIGENAFMNCHGLTKVEISNTVKSIEWCAFADCYALTSFTISKSVTNIKGGAFLECIGLTSIIVESGNTTYDSRDNCNAIIETATNTLIQGCKNTIIPYSVTSIGRHAFRNLSSLTSIVIPAGVKKIENMAFSSCGLTSITCEATEPPICGDDCFNAVDKSIPLYVPKGKVADYKAADGWKDFGENIQEISGGTGIEQVTNDQSQMTNGKILRNGQLYILYNGQMYNVQGQVVR